MPPNPDLAVTGLVLAGGAGRRMGGADKGLAQLQGRPLVRWVLERLEPQVDELLISANRNFDRYAALGARVVRDPVKGFAGPLAGLQAGLLAARHPLLVCAPCDSPTLPTDFVARLVAPIRDRGADAAVVRIGDRVEAVCCSMRVSCLSGLNRFVERGGRKMSDWLESVGRVEVAFDDEADAFRNLNTVEQLTAFAGFHEK